MEEEQTGGLIYDMESGGLIDHTPHYTRYIGGIDPYTNNPCNEIELPVQQEAQEPEDVVIDRTYFKLPDDQQSNDDSQNNNDSQDEQEQEGEDSQYDWNFTDGHHNDVEEQIQKEMEAQQLKEHETPSGANIIRRGDEIIDMDTNEVIGHVAEVSVEMDEDEEGFTINVPDKKELEEQESERITVLKKLRNFFN